MLPTCSMAESCENPQQAEQNSTSEEFRQEREYFQRVINAFLYYRTYALAQVQHLHDNYQGLPLSHQKMLPHFPAHIASTRRAVETNYEFVKSIVSSAVGMFENSEVSEFDSSTASQRVVPASSFDMEKVKTTVKQFFRDWSKEGAKEREMCYKPIIDEIVHRFPPDKCEAGEVSILVPGAGLGRLAYELARQGYSCQGNEFSMFMLLGSNFILNQMNGVCMHTICPWAHQFSNNLSYDHQTMEIRIPDVDPSNLPCYGLFSMAAGDFLELYHKEEWDCVACSFFIDTAHNVIQYLEKIYQILKPGGFWINMGPLLYHYADMPGEFSIELSWEDVRRIAEEDVGFEILREEHNLPSHYIQNPNSMMQMTYKCVFLVARKQTHSQSSDKRSVTGKECS